MHRRSHCRGAFGLEVFSHLGWISATDVFFYEVCYSWLLLMEFIINDTIGRSPQARTPHLNRTSSILTCSVVICTL
jgi:hypothetical protein